MLEQTISEIAIAVNATEPPKMFLSTDNNFRYEVAKTKPYKGTRKHDNRPYHYENIRAYIQGVYDCVVCDGYEADDGLGIEQCSRLKDKDTVICSRDKDLLMIPGYHYVWHRGQQQEKELFEVDELGTLSLHSRLVKNKVEGRPPTTVYKLSGTGQKFFYAQLLMGDTVDNIPGCRGYSNKSAYDILKDANSVKECHELVKDTYNIVYRERAEEMLIEQANLLWIIREKDEDNNLVFWKAPT